MFGAAGAVGCSKIGITSERLKDPKNSSEVATDQIVMELLSSL